MRFWQFNKSTKDEKNANNRSKASKNRAKTRREKARKAKNRLKKHKSLHGKSDLYVALYQISQAIKHQFPNLLEDLENISDPRKRRQYKMQELLLGCIMMYVFKEGSRNGFNQDRKTKQFSKNYRRLFGVRLPHMDTVDEVLRKIDTKQLETLKGLLLKGLFEKRVLHKFRLLGKQFGIAIDATGYASFDYKPYDCCSYRTSKNGKITYLQPILEAKLVTQNGFSISIATEWVLNDEEYEKQDCELKAFKRLAARLKRDYPRLPICILADGLYPNKSVFDICKQHNWAFIITLKDTQLKDVQLEVALFDRLYSKNTLSKEKVVNKEQLIKHTYRWINEIDYHGHALNWVECVETKRNIKTGKEEQNRFGYITNFKASSTNCEVLCAFGRLRWKIENEGFNNQKNGGYQLQHKYSRNNLTAIQNYYQCMQIGHLINQVVELSKRFKQLKGKFTLKHIWKVMVAFMYFGEIDNRLLAFKKTQFRYT